jgi:DNA-binding transcriptional MocR family regulator
MYKYLQLAEHIRDKIKSGEYRAGEKLPSIKKMAGELSVNSDTIIKAYQRLEAEHYIYTCPKSGFYVMKTALEENKEKGEIDLVTVRPPDSLNPYKDFNHCMEQANVLYGRRLYDYASSKGLPELTEIAAEYLTDFQIFVNPNRIFITSGAQQALYILSVMEFPDRRGKVLVEQPTYSMLLQILLDNQVPLMGIQRTREGIDLIELERIFREENIRFFYLMPRYQNPTGFSYTLKQKKAIAKLAKVYQVYLVEDDYVADLEKDSKADSLYSLGDKKRIIYIRSFSKTLLPGLRLGMAIVPEELQENFLKVKRSMDLNTTVLTQGALEVYLKSGMYKNHIQQIRKYYAERMDFLRKICETYLAGRAVWYIPASGIYALIQIDKAWGQSVIKRLSKERILLKDTEECYLPETIHEYGIRLCICNTGDEELERTIKAIRRCLELYMEQEKKQG